MYPAAAVNGAPAPGYSTGQTVASVEDLQMKELPPSMLGEWTELTFLQKKEGNTAIYIFPLCMLFVFLTHAAEYESWSLPVGIIMIVPMSLLCALIGIGYAGLDNDIFTQIGFIVLIGLACKNAVLIIEFATHVEKHERLNPFNAVLSASKLRLRPILMTSFAFILGVVPLMLSKGAGAEMRRTLGTAVFSGMLGVTIFGIFLTPVFYLVIRWISGNKPLGQKHDHVAKDKTPGGDGTHEAHPVMAN
jgi:multidrug efflux pump